MYVKIGHKVITTPMEVILNEVRKELTNGKLKDIEDHGRNLIITCPSHKGGMETHPSCNVLNIHDDEVVEEGTAHCFTCGYTARLPKLIADLFDEDTSYGEEWLLDRFCNVFMQKDDKLPLFEKEPKKTNAELDEEVLKDFDFYHPYMWSRKLTQEVVDRFRVGYDRERCAITFPVYDEKGKLVMVTARSVLSKRFYIPTDVEKPVYLLYDIINRGVTKVFVCESQINALTLRSWGFDSIALFGTGSKTQMETLKRSGIREYVLCFDGDDAGRKGANRFKRSVGKDVFITDLKMPHKKDVNDLTKEEFEILLKTS